MTSENAAVAAATDKANPTVGVRYHMAGDYYDVVTDVRGEWVHYTIERSDGTAIGTGEAVIDCFWETRHLPGPCCG